MIALRSFVVTALALASVAAIAQDSWPARPVRIVVPSSPGGGTDVYARLLGQRLGEQLKQQFVIDNRPGASGNIGTEAVAKAAPDGYTFLVSANAAIAINPALFKSVPFDMDRDFAPVTRGVMAPMVLAANPDVPAKTLGELVALAKRDPGKLAFGSAGNGSPTYLGVRMIEEAAGVRFLHVPYKGVGPAYQGLLGGQLAFMFPDVASALAHIRSGKLVALAVNERTPLLPSVPTLAEAGLPGLQVWTSFSVLAPAGTPPAIVQRLNTEIGAAMKSPALAEKLAQQALVPVFDTPAEFAAALTRERAYWAAFIRRNNIQPEE
jgi:tripartite-type tricarboxylate transporter receptor subunit TctC